MGKKTRNNKKEPIFHRDEIEGKMLEEEMKGEWVLHERFFDRHVIEAICPHGVGHHKGVHGCDGCCAHAPKEMWTKVSKDN